VTDNDGEPPRNASEHVFPDWLNAAASGTGRGAYDGLVTYVNAPPGTGKAALIQRMASAIDSEAYVVLTAFASQAAHLRELGVTSTTLARAAETINAVDADAVLPKNLNTLMDRASKHGVAGLSFGQVFILVLAWLMMIGMPIAQQMLPADVQNMITGEVGTIGLGLALTAIIVKNRG
jgi:hypothetical protein